MGEPHYTPSGYPRRNKPGSSQFMRDEFKRIETGIGDMNRYVLQTEHRATHPTTQIFLTCPWDCIVTRVGFVVHDVPGGGSWRVWFGDVTGAIGNSILLEDADSSDEYTLFQYPAAGVGATRFSRTTSRNVFSAGDVIGSTAREAPSNNKINITTFIELQRTGV